ncbi:1-phosphofructokinase family hexose kinase [Paenactinomyces guangxiensis]|uniref:Tagatose-6-phosphate kinase n=1 Tax=Paenactinomyces guangxiensis TaxID=1490290 RepID=A0A7W1WV13_9BACL|nr:1-phosphofructokinase family hexose kinase [Paenactinomyces guangxiensis]MBA4496361.1 1-phosphofructokinase family hexose kinase [Paenactinomyces guangxiensis]MBH8593606.1 1-phosphofructokinase family hexose kinase [Paenactinomyces guangxiensis]
MIRIVCPNPATDRTILLPKLIVNEVNRAISTYVVPGGKGINVARACKYFQKDTTVYGFVGGAEGKGIRHGCRRMGIFDRWTEIKGNTRVCNIYVEKDTGRATVINEPGPTVTEEEENDLKNKLQTDTREDDIVIMSGSLPSGVSSRFYTELVDTLSGKQAKIIVDTSGKALQYAMQVKPWLVKPNLEEFAEISGFDPHTVDYRDLLKEMKKYVNQGAEQIIVTLGKDGLLYAGRERCFRIKSPSIPAVNPIASGDTLLGGFVSNYVQTGDIEESLKLGVACAAANAMSQYPGIPSDADIGSLLAQIEVQKAD